MTESATRPSPGDLGAQALEIAKRRQEAASEVMRLLERHFAAGNPTSETVLFAAAWLAGTSLYRSFGIEAKLEPGTVVLSEKSNEEWPKLMRTFLYLLPKFGVQVKDEDAATEISKEHRSQQDLLTIQSALQTPYNEIMQRHGFDFAEGAKTGAVLCALLVKAYCATTQRLKPGLAASIVAMGFIEGAKTVPAPLSARLR